MPKGIPVVCGCDGGRRGIGVGRAGEDESVEADAGVSGWIMLRKKLAGGLRLMCEFMQRICF